MNRTVGTTLPIALASTALAATAVALLLPGSAGAASSYPPATFEMYANVDSGCNLGSNVGTTSVVHIPGASGCEVTFSKAVGHCAAIVQPGEAGGTDQIVPADPVVDYVGSPANYATNKSRTVVFEQPDGNGGVAYVHDPFMMVVTCKK